MVSRVMVAVVGIPLLLLLFLMFPLICLPIFFGIANVIAVHEILWATGAVKHKSMVAVSMLLALLVPFWYYFGASVSVGLTSLFVYMLCLFGIAIASNQTVKFEEMGVSFFAAVLLPMMLSSFVLLSDLENGRWFTILPFVASFCSDSAALFFGMAFGKHKLAPHLSPKKTIEGSVGGFIGSVFGCLVYSQILRLGLGFTPNIVAFLLYGVLGSFISQMGDLSFSYIKRQFQLKDYGYLLPGHGGVLDRLDSVLFCAPFTYIMVLLIPFLQK